MSIVRRRPGTMPTLSAWSASRYHDRALFQEMQRRAVCAESTIGSGRAIEGARTIVSRPLRAAVDHDEALLIATVNLDWIGRL